jgi:ribose 5-phosphate isomerase B
MRIAVGCDHAAYELKKKIVAHLTRFDHFVEDMGTHSAESVDYPQYAVKVARKVANGEADRGILMCGSGIGMSMVANRVSGVRAAVVCEPYGAKMSRRHNDSNVLCLGARFLGEDLVFEILDTWLNEPFEGGRHQRRVELIDQLTGDKD